VNATLHRLGRGKTVFRVAHRLEDVADADVILVLRDGEILEQGTHAKLLHAGGWYQWISTLQRERTPAPAADPIRLAGGSRS